MLIILLQSQTHAVRQQPRLRKEASSALIGLGEAILADETPAEIDSFVGGGIIFEKLLFAKGYWIAAN